jgi:hypothetical protein
MSLMRPNVANLQHFVMFVHWILVFLKLQLGYELISPKEKGA